MFKKGFRFNNKKFPDRIRDIHKIEKNNCISMKVFSFCIYCLKDGILKCHVKIALRLMINEGLKCLKLVNMIESKIIRGK